MNTYSAKSEIHSLSRVLTCGRIASVLIGLFFLTAYAQADVSFNGTTFTGNGEYDQPAGTADEPLTANLTVTADADASTIILSGGVYTTGNLTHNKGKLTIASGTTNSVNKFQIQKGGANGTTANIEGVVIANSLTVNGTGSCTSYLNISGELNVSGTVIFNGAASGQGILNQTGGTVNFTTSADQNICIGLYETGASYPARYNLSAGTFNALNATTYVGWNGPGELNISGGEANLKGIQLVGGWNSTTGYAKDAKGTINLTGGKLNIGANGVTLKNSRHAINLGDGTIGALESHTWASTLTVTLTSGKTPTFNIDSGKTITIDSATTGAGSLKKTGAGTLTLTKAPGYTGSTTLEAGTLVLSAGGTLYNLTGATSTTLDTNGNAVTLNNSSATEFSGVITGSGSVTKTGSGSLTISADANGQPYTGGTTVSAGTLYLKGTNNGKSSVGTGDLTISSGAIVEAQSANVLGHTSASNMPHVIINGGTLKPRQYLHMKSVELNGGTITASTVSGGTGLDFNNRNGVITSTGSSSIASPIVNTSTLTINVKSGTLSLSGTINSTVGSTYKTIKTGSGTLSTSNWINNIVELQEGTLKITGGFGNGKRFNGEITIAKGATLNCAAKDSLGYGSANTKMYIYGLMDSTVDNETLNNTELHMYGGTAQASSGSTFDILNTGVKFFSYALDGATAENPTVSTISASVLFRINGTFPIDTAENSQLNLTGSIQNFFNNTRYNCTIAKTGKGTLVLSGANTHTNPTSISAGTLQLTGDAVAANGPVSIGETATLEFNLAEGQTRQLTFTDSNKITGSGTIIKTGEGVLQLYADAEGLIDSSKFIVSSGRLDMKEYYKGSMEVGVIDLENSDNNSIATFSPGNSVGTLIIDGAFKINGGSTLLIEQDATGMDKLVANSFDVASDSILELTLGAVVPGATYAIIQDSDSELAGVDFWNSILTPESSYYWNLSVDGNTLYATLDANAVPEPSTWALLILGTAGLFWLRRKNSSKNNP